MKQEETQRYSLYGGLTLVLIFALFMVNRFRVTNNQKKLIEEQKRIAQIQAEARSKEAEREVVLESKKVEPLEDPFGSGLLPMSPE